MTNEEAAKELMMAYEDLKHMCYMDCGREAAFNKACENLKAEPGKDAVSRSAVLDLMRTNWADNDGDTAMQMSIVDVRDLPKAAVEDAVSRGAVLDEIRADIQENVKYNKRMNYLGIVAGLLLALDIIDKYKGESE